MDIHNKLFLYSEFCLTQSYQKRLSLGLNTEKLNYKDVLFKFGFTMKMSVLIAAMDNLFLTSHFSLQFHQDTVCNNKLSQI
jgi:hypothetical protein